MSRSRLTLVISIVTALILAIAMFGCGGNAAPAPTSAASPAPTPAPTPAPPTNPPSGGGGASASSAPFQQAIRAIVNYTPVGQYGMVSVSSTGDVTVQAAGAQPNAKYAWSFCKLSGGCLDLGQTLATDPSGNGQITFHFPQTGNWAGYFSGQAGSSVIDTQDAAHVSMTGILVSSDALNGSAPCGERCLKDPAQGSVTVANGTAHIVISGGFPSHTYEVVLYGGGSTQGSLTTDASGNATADLPVVGGHGATYVLGSVVSGFTIK